MQRVVKTLVGMRDRWLSRVKARSNILSDLSCGLDAYTHRQADVYWSLAISFVDLWAPELRKSNIKIDWPSEVADRAATVDAAPISKTSNLLNLLKAA